MPPLNLLSVVSCPLSTPAYLDNRQPTTDNARADALSRPRRVSSPAIAPLPPRLPGDHHPSTLAETDRRSRNRASIAARCIIKRFR